MCEAFKYRLPSSWKEGERVIDREGLALSSFMFHVFLDIHGLPPFFFLTLFWTREYVKNSILLNLLDLGVFTHCRLD